MGKKWKRTWLRKKVEAAKVTVESQTPPPKPPPQPAPEPVVEKKVEEKPKPKLQKGYKAKKNSTANKKAKK